MANDAATYVGPGPPSDPPTGTYPRWMYNALLPPVVVETLAAQLALGAGWSTAPLVIPALPSATSSFIGSFASFAALNAAFPASVLSPGMTAYTADQGQCVWSGSWSTGAVRTVVTKLRALLAQAQVGQATPATAQPLIQPSAHPGNAAAVAKGQSFSNSGNNYTCIVAGTTGTGTAPTATTTGALVDGTVSWYYMGPTFTSNANAPTFTNVAAGLGAGSVYWTNTNGTRTDSTTTRNRDSSNFLVTGTAFTDGGATGITGNLAVGGPQNGLSQALLMSVSFMTDATTFQVAANGASVPNAQFYVNGVPLTLAYGSAAVQSQSAYFWNFVFATKANRLITMEILTPLAFYGVITSDATSKVWAPSYANSFRMSITGSSFISGSAQHPVTQSLGWGALMAKLLNCNDYWQDAFGSGSGYINGNNFFLPTRFNAMVAYAPDVVVVAGGGINDAAGTTFATLPQEQAAVLAYLTQVRAALPKALILVIGAEAGAKGPTAAIFQMELAANRAVTQLGDPLCLFIPQSSTSAEKAWVSGTGTTAATNGSGNSEIYIGADTTHPVQAGCLYYAQQSANGIMNAINGLN